MLYADCGDAASRLIRSIPALDLSNSWMQASLRAWDA